MISSQFCCCLPSVSGQIGIAVGRPWFCNVPTTHLLIDVPLFHLGVAFQSVQIPKNMIMCSPECSIFSEAFSHLADFSWLFPIVFTQCSLPGRCDQFQQHHGLFATLRRLGAGAFAVEPGGPADPKRPCLMRCPGDPKKWPKMRRCFPVFFCLMVYLYTYLYRSIQYLYYVYTPIKMFSSDRTYAKKDIWKDGAWKQIISGDLKPSNRSNCVMIQVCPLHPLLSGQWDFTVSWQTVCYLLPHEPFIRRNPAPVDRW